MTGAYYGAALLLGFSSCSAGLCSAHNDKGIVMRTAHRLLILLSLMPLGLTACSTLGGFFGETQGPVFTAQQPVGTSRVIVYIYRPKSDWADQELEAPGLFLNNQFKGSLPSNGYLVFEFDPARYKIELRRPLFGGYWTWFADGPLDFVRIASFSLDTEVGRSYFFRYDELNPPPGVSASPMIGDGPLQLVSASVAQPEIAYARKVQPLIKIDAEVPEERPQRSFWRSVGESLQHIGI